MRPSSEGQELFRRIGNTRRWIALSSILGIVTIGSGIGLLALATYLLTRSALLGTAASLSLVILGVRFFALTRVVGRYCERYLGHLGTFRVLTRLRVWLFGELITTNAIVLATQRRGDVVTGLVDDVDTMQDRLLRVSSPLFVALGTFLVAFTSLAVITIQCALLFSAFFLAASLLLPPLLRSRTGDLSARLIKLRAQRLTEVTELLDGLDTLETWGRSDLVSKHLAQFDTKEASLSRALTRNRALIDSCVITLTGLCVLALVVTLRAVHLSYSNVYWIGAVPLIALAAFEAMGPLLAVPDFRAQTDAAAKRILDLANASPLSPSRTSALTDSTSLEFPDSPTFEIANVSYAYDGSAPILRDATLSIPFGTTIAIVAPSGSGKSTFLKLLAGLLPLQTGSISIGEIAPTELPHGPRPLIATVMQDDHLFDTTVRDNLLVGDGEATDEHVTNACIVAGLESFLDARPDGLDAPTGPNGALLSGGERQRLMIARAILADSPILLLDEATEHLEPERRASVIEAVLRHREGRTTIILAHDADAIARADLVYDLVEGEFRKRPN